MNISGGFRLVACAGVAGLLLAGCAGSPGGVVSSSAAPVSSEVAVSSGPAAVPSAVPSVAVDPSPSDAPVADVVGTNPDATPEMLANHDKCYRETEDGTNPGMDPVAGKEVCDQLLSFQIELLKYAEQNSK